MKQDYEMRNPKAMKRQNFLYWATGGWLVLIVMIGMYFLFQATMPSADVTNQPRSTIYVLSVDNIEPGQARSFVVGDVPIVVWHRDFAQKIEALELLGIDVSENPDLLEKVRSNGEIEIEPGRLLRSEWFVVSPINTGGYGCVVLSNAGDFGGFLDPCQDVHFDLWGRVQTGPTKTGLQVLSWTISHDGNTITVDVDDAPKLE
jgi:ubiquinol-cytochrome c reductase iron-sulfur subunit